MADNHTDDQSPRRITRRGVILTAAIVVVVAVVVVFLVRSIASSDDATPSPTGSSASIRPSVTPSAVYTPVPVTPAPTATGRVVQPTGTATPGTEAKPVPLGSTAQPVSGVHVSIAKLTAVQGVAHGVGEVDGPAIRFQVLFANGTKAGIPLSDVVVNVTYGKDATPADELATSRVALPASIDKGKTASGTYVFTLPEADRNDVQITVDYHVGVPITVFTGTAPR